MTRLDCFHNMSRYGGCEVRRQSALWVLWSGALPDTFPHLALGEPNWEYGLSLSLPLPLLLSTHGQEALIAVTLSLPRAHFECVCVFIGSLVECFCFCRCRWTLLLHKCSDNHLTLFKPRCIYFMMKYPDWNINGKKKWQVCVWKSAVTCVHVYKESKVWRESEKVLLPR